MTDLTTRELISTKYGSLIHDHSLTTDGHQLIATALTLVNAIRTNQHAGLTHDWTAIAIIERAAAEDEHYDRRNSLTAGGAA